MWPVIVLLSYCLLIVLASLAGGWLSLLLRMTHTRHQLMMSAAGGMMIGVAILHLLPHAIMDIERDRIHWVSAATLIGIIATFLMIQMFHVHQHGEMDGDAEHAGHHLCEHDHDHQHANHESSFSWAGLFFGMALHSFIDGIAVAASVTADSHHPSIGVLLGLATFLAVLFHKPLDALSITAVMKNSGWPSNMTHIVNFMFSLTCPVGAMAFYFGVEHFSSTADTVIPCVLGFSAGVFLCISLADILPEIQFHSHDRIKLGAALLGGLMLAAVVTLVESGHDHQHGRSQPPPEVRTIDLIP